LNAIGSSDEKIIAHGKLIKNPVSQYHKDLQSKHSLAQQKMPHAMATFFEAV
jgi:hypothetical protein